MSVCAVPYAGHMWLLSARNTASATEDLTVLCYLMVINLNSHMWLVAATVDSTDLEASLKC